METMISGFIAVLRAALLSRTTLALENAALRQQLTIYQRNQKHPAQVNESALDAVVSPGWILPG